MGHRQQDRAWNPGPVGRGEGVEPALVKRTAPGWDHAFNEATQSKKKKASLNTNVKKKFKKLAVILFRMSMIKTLTSVLFSTLLQVYRHRLRGVNNLSLKTNHLVDKNSVGK